MTTELFRELKIQHAIAIAMGKCAARRTRDNHAPRTTGYPWAAGPRIRRVVQSWRIRYLKQLKLCERTAQRRRKIRPENPISSHDQNAVQRSSHNVHVFL
jgi:hypothetical protein